MHVPCLRSRILGAASVALAGAFAFAQPSLADLPPAFAHARVALRQAGSFHVVVRMNVRGRTTIVNEDVQSMQPLAMESESNLPKFGTMRMVFVDDNAYAEIGSSGWRKMPKSVAALGTMDLMKLMGDRPSDFTAIDLGERAIEGRTLHAFKVVNHRRNTPAQMVYLDDQGRPALIEGGGLRMQFSNFGEDLDIAPPA